MQGSLLLSEFGVPVRLDPLRILRPVFDSAAPSANSSPSPPAATFSRIRIVQAGAAQSASSSAAASPEPLGGSAALRRTDGLPPFNAGAAAHAEDAGGRGQTAAGPTPAPPPRVQRRRMTVGRGASGRAAGWGWWVVGVGGLGGSQTGDVQ